MTIIARMHNRPMHVNAFETKVAIPCITVENDNPKAMDHNQIAPMMTRNGIISVLTMRGFEVFATATGETDGGAHGDAHGETDGDADGDADGETELVESIGETTGEDDIIIGVLIEIVD